jgi:hypothetical protein
LGLNPYAVLYKKGSYYADRTQIFSFMRSGRRDKKTHWDYWANLKRYTLDTESSLRFLNSKEFIFLKKSFVEKNLAAGVPIDSSEFLDLYFSNINGDQYAGAFSMETNVGFSYVNKISKKFTFFTNFNANLSLGDMTSFDQPSPRAFDALLETSYGNSDAMLSSTLKYVDKRLIINATSSVIADVNTLSIKVFPKISASYQVHPTKKLYAFATFGNGVKYYSTQNRVQSKIVRDALFSSSILLFPYYELYESKYDYLTSSTINKNLLLGFKSKNIGLYYTYNRFENLVKYQPYLVLNSAFSGEGFYGNGFFTEKNSFINFNSITAYLKFDSRKFNSFKKKLLPFPFSWTVNYTYSFGKEDGRDYIAQVPKYQFQNNFAADIDEKLSLNLVHNYSSSVYDRFRGKKANHYNVFDLMFFYRFNKNLNAQLCVRNLLDAEYSGISATGTSDDLIYNPQSLRTIQVGLTYSLK